MFVWCILFLLNFLLAKQADVLFSKKKFTYSKLCLFLILIIDTLIIGLRDFGVGTDTVVYIETYYEIAKYSDFSDFFSIEELDKGYLFLAYISTLFSSSPQSLMVCTEFFIMFFLLLGVYELRKTIDYKMSSFMLLFWLIYNHETINLMRQFCAMSLLFYGYSLFLQKKYYSYFSIQFIAYFFHTSSVLFLMVPMFYYFSTIEGRWKILYSIGVFVIIILMQFLYYKILTFFGSTGIFKAVYFDRYGKDSEFVRSYSYGLRGILVYVTSFMLLLYSLKSKLLSREYFYMIISLFIATFLLEQMRFIQFFFFRMSYYVGMVSIVYYSVLLKNKSLKARVIQFFYLFVLFINAFFLYTAKSTNGFCCNEYRSTILGL